MKANEFMIGDLVQHRDEFNDVTGPYEIDLISNDEIAFKGELFARVFNNKIEPIPITAEILEKNGFEKVQIHGEKQDDIFQCFDGEIIIEVGIYDPNFILIRYHQETPDGIDSGELSSIVKVDGEKFYLHELQHALRLCGIDKEIVV